MHRLTLNRSYFPLGTNGLLYYNNELICSTIELPWNDNKQETSCIPEGIYALELIPSEDYDMVIRLLDVPGREGIDIHPANDALKELKGCIAPVSKTTGEGKGVYSRRAFYKLRDILIEILQEYGDCELIVTSDGTMVIEAEAIDMSEWSF
ncbi:DUF5675 family protein [Penaeicola halotolerans]|uniref:DUF5675 family protein n=1 Tax=Penaeicola halotolerans TaxID=2793196 RepID=UPI001CF7EE06|nr:DUF5675 family protein [Penaeicola halotolerans]